MTNKYLSIYIVEILNFEIQARDIMYFRFTFTHFDKENVNIGQLWFFKVFKTKLKKM